MSGAGEGENRKKNVEMSIDYAKQAINMDLQDGESWYVLGNAMLIDFFVNLKKIDQLNMALKAYNQAVSLLSTLRVLSRQLNANQSRGKKEISPPPLLLLTQNLQGAPRDPRGHLLFNSPQNCCAGYGLAQIGKVSVEAKSRSPLQQGLDFILSG